MQTDNDTCYTTDSFSELLVHLNGSLSSYRHFPQSIKQALKSIGEYSKHNRVNIIEIHNNMTFRIAYEWCDKETPPTPEKWKQARLLYNPVLEKQLYTRNYIIIRNENSTDPEIQTLLEEQHCRQMLLLPLFESGANLAFLSFVQCRNLHEWPDEEIRTLSQLSSIIATRLNNYLLFHRLLSYLKKYHEQNVSFILQYARLKNLRTALSQTREKIADKTTGLPEWTEIEKHISNLDKICQALIEK